MGGGFVDELAEGVVGAGEEEVVDDIVEVGGVFSEVVVVLVMDGVVGADL